MKNRFSKDTNGVFVVSPDGKHGQWCEEKSQLLFGFLSNILRTKCVTPERDVQGLAVLEEDMDFAEGMDWLGR